MKSDGGVCIRLYLALKYSYEEWEPWNIGWSIDFPF
jgi:hypothetical protein